MSVSDGNDGRNANDLDILVAARRWLDEHDAVALASVVATWGSSPVPVGGQMAVAGEDRFQGSVSGGCVENDVIVAALDVIATGAPQLLNFGVSNETAWQSGLPCGGSITILIARLTREHGAPLLDELLALQARRAPAIVVTDTATGDMRLYRDGDSLPKWAADARARGESQLAEREDGGQAFVHLLTPPPRIVVVGATHIAQHLVTMLGLVGYDCIVVDPRSAYASQERFAGASILAQWPDDALPALALDPYSALVAVSHNPDIDDAALRHALSAGCFYVGALGSKRNHARRRERLAASGVTSTAIDRIRAPIGLDIGAHGAAEIAASILAEIIAAFRKKARA